MNIVNSIEKIYQSINIYRSLLIYNKTHENIIHTVYNGLISLDFPVAFTNNINNVNNNYRIYLVDIDQCNSLETVCDLKSISIIFYLDDNDLANIEKLNCDKIFITKILH
jgi:hypothetical protein